MSNVQPMRLLVVEDSIDLLEPLVAGLSRSGYQVDKATDGRTALAMAQERVYDLIVLDIMLPRVDGLTVLKRLRDAGSPSRVLMLTAKDTLDDRVTGLRGGADDYLVKPFAFDELLARIEALFRRGREVQDRVSIGSLTVDLSAKTAWRASEPLSLTAREYSILEYMVRNRGRLVTRTELEQHVYDNLVEPMSNVVDSAICLLRRKIDDDGVGASRSVIRTRRGQGYIVPTEASAAEDA